MAVSTMGQRPQAHRALREDEGHSHSYIHAKTQDLELGTNREGQKKGEAV